MAKVKLDNSINEIVEKYLTIDGEKHNDAIEVVNIWTAYLNTYDTAIAAKYGQSLDFIPEEHINQGLLGAQLDINYNPFWMAYAPQLNSMIVHELTLRVLGKELLEQDPLYLITMLHSRLSFIGMVVFLANKQNPKIYKEFEKEFRMEILKSTEEMFKNVREALKKDAGQG